jgi:ABC-type uncharacterized transport system substrate-binding protein
MAPGILLDQADRPGRVSKIYMMPAPDAMLQRYKTLQPAMKTMAVIWMFEGMRGYIDDLVAAGKNLGIHILVRHVDSKEDLPDALRSVSGAADALWMPADAQLVTVQTFAIFKEFCWTNKMPFYMALDGFVEKGATASVSCDYRDIGRAAGEAAKRALAGQSVAEKIFVTKSVLSISLSAADHMELKIDPELLRSADRTVP